MIIATNLQLNQFNPSSSIITNVTTNNITNSNKATAYVTGNQMMVAAVASLSDCSSSSPTRTSSCSSPISSSSSGSENNALKAQSGNTNLINSLSLDKTSEELENNHNIYINNGQDFSNTSKTSNTYNFISNTNQRINNMTTKNKSSLNQSQQNNRYHPYAHSVKQSNNIMMVPEATTTLVPPSTSLTSSYDPNSFYTSNAQYLQSQMAYAYEYESQKEYNSQQYQQVVDSQPINVYQQLQQQQQQQQHHHHHQYPVHFYQNGNVESSSNNSNNFSSHNLGFTTNVNNNNNYYYNANQINQMANLNGDTNPNDFVQANQMDHQTSMNTELYLFNNKHLIKQQQFTNSIEYLNSLNHDQNEHLINLVNSKKQEYAAAKSTSNLYNNHHLLFHHNPHNHHHHHHNQNNNDSLVPTSSLASSSSISSSAASSPLSTSLNNQDSIAPSKLAQEKNGLKGFVSVDAKDVKLTNRQSRITAFHLSRATKKQKLIKQQQRIQGSDLDIPPKASKLKHGLKHSNKKMANDTNSKLSKTANKPEIKSEPSVQQHQQGEPKKRVSANKKERRRTQSINCAFEELRNRIPEIPHDTKLSKIKTLKLATEYIEHLMRLLEEGAPNNGPIEISFKPDLGKLRRECRSKEIKVFIFYLF
jgi:hypothetical protein